MRRIKQVYYYLDNCIVQDLISAMNEQQLRDEIVQIGCKLYSKEFVAGTDGNISARLDETRILITPSGYPKGELDPDQLIIIDPEGNIISGENKPSSEYRMHLLFYNKFENINAVVHAHPPITTAYSISGKKIQTNILPEGILLLRNLARVEYGTPSTNDLTSKIEKYLPDSDIFVLENHGVTAIGENLREAYCKLEVTEHIAKMNLYSGLIGGTQCLDSYEVTKLLNIYKIS